MFRLWQLDKKVLKSGPETRGGRFDSWYGRLAHPFRCTQVESEPVNRTSGPAATYKKNSAIDIYLNVI